MSHSLTEAATWDATVTVPDNGDDENAASVDGAFQSLTDRTAFLAYGARIGNGSYASANNTDLSFDGLRIGLGGKFFTQTSFTLTLTGLANNTWYYVYAWNNAGTLTLEQSTTAPSATTGYAFKTGDTTRVYLGCCRTDGSAHILPFVCRRGRYMYRNNVAGSAAPTFWRAITTGASTGGADVALKDSGGNTNLVPLHAAHVILVAQVNNGDAADQTVSVGPYGESSDFSIQTAAGHQTGVQFEIPAYVNAGEVTAAYITGAAACTLDLYVKGFQE